jgi:hypothetical protein
VTRIFALTAWFACLLLSAGLVIHLARAGMDNPIPPLRQASNELTKGTGYCVSVTLDGVEYGTVDVPFHKPDKNKLDELRVSIANAYRLVALQQKDPEKAAALREAANHIRVPGDPELESTRKRPINSPSYPSVGCVCSSLYTPGVVPGRACGGACGDCYYCGGGK